MSQFYCYFVSIISILLHNSTTKMKIYTIPIFVLMVGLLGYCVHQQAETKKHEELHQILKEVQHSTKLLNANRPRP